MTATKKTPETLVPKNSEVFFLGVTGFEPTTPSSLTKCASQLRYTPIRQAPLRNRPDTLWYLRQVEIITSHFALCKLEF